MIVLPAITRRFENLGRTFTLDLPEIALRSSELTFLSGPNGSGKSLLLRTLSGDSVEGGGAWDSQGRLPRGSILVKQEIEANLCASLTAVENLAIWRRSARLLDWLFPVRALRPNLVEMEHICPALKGAWSRETSSLSGGQQQALAILARTQAFAPLLLLDEVTSAVDAVSSQDLMRLIEALSRQPDRQVLAVSHDVNEMAAFGTRVLVMAGGRLFRDLRASAGTQLSADEIARTLREAWQAHTNGDAPLEVPPVNSPSGVSR